LPIEDIGFLIGTGQLPAVCGPHAAHEDDDPLMAFPDHRHGEVHQAIFKLLKRPIFPLFRNQKSSIDNLQSPLQHARTTARSSPVENIKSPSPRTPILTRDAGRKAHGWLSLGDDLALRSHSSRSWTRSVGLPIVD
jgi:hypothetical protein